MTTFARQAEVLILSEDQALDSYSYLIRTREKIADRFPKYVEEREAASATMSQLARIEVAFGTDAVRDMLNKAEGRAAMKRGAP